MEFNTNVMALQQPVWPDEHEIRRVGEQLSALPELAPPVETELLAKRLARVALRQMFVVQCGPCAEPIEHAPEEVIDLAMAAEDMRSQIVRTSHVATVPILRVAGQFCKPRSSDTETINGITLPSFRGELVNGPAFTLESRTPDPQRLLRAHDSAQRTRRLLRSVMDGEIFTAHEALLLDYELPQVQDITNIGPRSTSANFLWIGDRTKAADGAHVALCASVGNPVGVKLGPDTDPAEVVELCERLNPNRIPGRLSLIPRFGTDRIGQTLTPIIDAVEAGNHSVLWVLDPMHGNTITTEGGQKTRPFSAIVSEIDQFFEICHERNVWPGGIHLEMSGQAVTECLGADVQGLKARYETLCDPRINREQSKIIASRVGALLAKARKDQPN